jgi:hypothetical protein
MELTDEKIEKLRRSGIRLDSEGRFWHEGAEVTHARMRQAFFRWLDRLPDGRWVLRLDERRFVYLDVEDAPFVIESVRWQSDRPWAALCDGTEEPLACTTVRVSPAGVPYATAKGRFEARFSRAAWSALFERVVERDGAFWLDAASGPYRLAP